MRIALIHAVMVAIEPVNMAFRKLWPAAECMNVLDDTLSVDRAKYADLTPEIDDRIMRLAVYGRDCGADAIQFTCSAFGPAIAAADKALAVPVLKPNDAMFQDALTRGRRIGMLATFPASIGSMEAEFRELVIGNGADATIESICVPEAMTALRNGDGARHDKLLAEAAPRLGHCDAIMLAQFSTARAQAAVQAASGKPTLTSPESAVTALKQMFG